MNNENTTNTYEVGTIAGEQVLLTKNAAGTIIATISKTQVTNRLAQLDRNDAAIDASADRQKASNQTQREVSQAQLAHFSS
jgi:hypothetical protein